MTDEIVIIFKGTENVHIRQEVQKEALKIFENENTRKQSKYYQIALLAIVD